MTAQSDTAKIETPAKKTLLQFMWEFGLMRVVLYAFALLTVLFAPKPGTLPVIEGWDMVSTLLAPVLAPLILMVLLLDALMARLFMSDKTGVERAHYKRAILAGLLVSLGLVLYWLPYFMAMGR